MSLKHGGSNAQIRKQELDRLQQLEVIVPIDEPTPWVSSLAVVVKKSGALRICIDPRPLNTSLKRERYQLPVLEDILPELSKARVFTTVDLKSGYWHCVLAPESSVLTTFATPYGRYRWRRLPFGLSASSEIFQKHLNQALENLPGVLCIADDILIYGSGDADEEATADHDRNLQNLLQRCLDRGIVLSPEKMKLRRKAVPFMGHLLTSTGLKPDPAKVEAITNMPKPQDIEGVQRLRGNGANSSPDTEGYTIGVVYGTRQSISDRAEAGNGSSRSVLLRPFQRTHNPV